MDIDAIIERAKHHGSTSAEDLIGLGYAWHALLGASSVLTRPESARRFGLKPQHVLLVGAPGTGKTMLARCLSSQLNRDFYGFDASVLQEPETVRAIFDRLGHESVVLFFDELDNAASTRWNAQGDEKGVLAALLVAIDGLAAREPGRSALVIAAAVSDHAIDPALLRSGRLGLHVRTELPDAQHRAIALQRGLARLPHEDFDLVRCVERSQSATVADLQAYIAQAAIEALGTADDPVITEELLLRAIERAGEITRPDPVREPTLLEAIHEAGHAVLAHHLLGPDSLGIAMLCNDGLGQRGSTTLDETWSRTHVRTLQSLPLYVSFALGGAAAESIILGTQSAGVASDCDQATELLSQALGWADPAFGPSQSILEMIGDRGATGSEAQRHLAWSLVRIGWNEAWDRACRVVLEHQAEIETLAQRLLEVRVLSGEGLRTAIREAGQVALAA